MNGIRQYHCIMSDITLEQLNYGLPRLQEALPDFKIQGMLPGPIDSYYTDGSAQGSIYKLHIMPKGESFPTVCIYIWANGELWVGFSNSSLSTYMHHVKHWLLSLRGLA